MQGVGFVLQSSSHVQRRRPPVASALAIPTTKLPLRAVTDSLILETLAREAKSSVDCVRAVFDMLDAGLSVPFVGRFRRDQTHGLTEAHIRRLRQRREELVELDRRRATVLKAMEKDGADKAALDAVRSMTDRFELEDQYLPYRRPEPEVQLALDRGLGALADELVKSMPRPPKAQQGKAENTETEQVESEDPVSEETSPPADSELMEDAEVRAEKEDATGSEQPEPDAPSTEEAPSAESESPEEDAAQESGAPSGEKLPVQENPAVEAPVVKDATQTINAPKPAVKVAQVPQLLTPELARLCAQYVVPDKGVHSEEEALAGARRILADRLARNTSLRAYVRNMVRKHGDLRVRPLVEEKRAGRHKPLFRLKTSLRQLQGHKLIALRQAQKERVLSTVITLEPKHALKRVRAALGKFTRPEYESLLREIAEECFERRLLPTVEADVRLELKERGDREALRFLTQHLRAVLMAPVHGPLPMVGIDISARGDWTVAVLGRDGAVERVGRIDMHEKVPVDASEPQLESPTPSAEASAPAVDTIEALPEADAPEVVLPEAAAPEDGAVSTKEIKVSEATPDQAASDASPSEKPAPAPKPKFKSVPKSDENLGSELAALVGDNNPRALIIASQRTLRRHLPRLRLAAHSAGILVPALVTTDAGLSSYSNSEGARKELPEHSVPERTAISLARRAQDPLAELLKVDPWQLSLGPEQSLVSKANLRRALSEMVESTAALVGCRLNSAAESVLRALPGLDEEAVQRILTRRAERPIKSREELRLEEVLTEAQWASVVAFLRVPESEEPLDCTSLHPEQYPLVRRLLESVGTNVADSLGRPGVSKGLKRADFGVDEGTWRDLMRELSFPGRDARMRNRLPELLDPQTDPIRLSPGRVVEGVITSVAGFGAFVDVGLEREAMLHVSQLGRRYVRDAREDLSVGQTVRATIKESSEKRLTLSIADVPPPDRGSRGREGGGGGSGRGKGERSDRGPRVKLRPGDARGMPLGDPSGRRRRPAGGPGSRDRREREPRGERVNLKELNAEAQTGGNNAFAKFFKSPGEVDAQPATDAGPEPVVEGRAEEKVEKKAKKKGKKAAKKKAKKKAKPSESDEPKPEPAAKETTPAEISSAAASEETSTSSDKSNSEDSSSTEGSPKDKS